MDKFVLCPPCGFAIRWMQRNSTLATFEVPALVLMFCLAIVTTRSAYLLRLIEQEMPQIEPLPAGKMVVLACPDTAEVTPVPTEAVCVAMGEGNSTADVKTEHTDVQA